MTKKRKLNSKNPKYWDKSLLKEQKIKVKKFGCNAPIRDSSGNIVTKKTAEVNSIWYEN